MSALYANGASPDGSSDQRRNADWHQVRVDPSEAELIQRALSGQEEVLRELVRPWEHSLLKLSEE